MGKVWIEILTPKQVMMFGRLAKELGIEKNVFFLGRVSDKELLEYYGRSEFFISASEYEGFGITVVEAMAAGLPVVVTRRGGIPLAVKDNYNGFFVKLRNPEDIVEKVNILLDNKELRKKMKLQED